MFDLDKILVKSKFLQIVQNTNTAVIWHSLFGFPQIVSNETIEFINGFLEPITVRSKLGDKPTAEEMDVVNNILNCYFLIPKNFDEREYLTEIIEEREKDIVSGSLIDNLSLIMSEECNFRCVYCIHFNNLGKSERSINNREKFMRFDTAKKTIDGFLGILRSHGKRIAEINFGGGEPLLAWPVIKKVLEYCEKEYGFEFNFRFSINTNASLITLEIAEMLKKYHFEISSSLDGLQDNNDLVRLTRSGNGTFYQITKGFNVLVQVGYPLMGFAVTVTDKNFYGINESIIDWALANGIYEVRIDLDVIGMTEIPIEKIVAKLMRIRNYAHRKNVDVPGFWSRPAENLNESIIENSISFCGAVRGNSMCVSPSGDIYGCGYSTIKLGNLSEIGSFHASGGAYENFVRKHLVGSIDMCKGCIIEGQCAGGCNITQEFALATKSTKIERMCDFYRRMTQEILLDQLQNAETL